MTAGSRKSLGAGTEAVGPLRTLCASHTGCWLPRASSLLPFPDKPQVGPRGGSLPVHWVGPQGPSSLLALAQGPTQETLNFRVSLVQVLPAARSFSSVALALSLSTFPGVPAPHPRQRKFIPALPRARVMLLKPTGLQEGPARDRAPLAGLGTGRQDGGGKRP